MGMEMGRQAQRVCLRQPQEGQVPRWWQLNQGPVEEQPVLLTIETSKYVDRTEDGILSFLLGKMLRYQLVCCGSQCVY